MDVPAFLPTEPGDPLIRKMADGRKFLIHRNLSGWTWIEDGSPDNNGSFAIEGNEWVIVIESAAHENKSSVPTFDDVEKTMMQGRSR